MATKVITGKVRFSYANVFNPTAFDKDSEDKKYNVNLLISKKDKKTIAAIEEAIEAESEALKQILGVKVLPKNAKIAELRDGDEEYPDDETMEGMYFLRASSKTKPGVVVKDPDTGKINDIMSEDEFYSGCYGKASINVYAYGSKDKPYKGVAFGLNNVMKTEEGEALGGGRASAESDFGDDDDLL